MNTALRIVLNLIGLWTTILVLSFLIQLAIGNDFTSYIIQLVVAFGTGLFWPWSIFERKPK